MHVHNLPGDILVLVLEKTVGASDDIAHRFKSTVPLLSVCQRWRCVALPMAYNKLYVRYGAVPNLVSGTYSCYVAASEPTDVVVATNLDLIVAAGCVHMVRTAKIDVHFVANPFPGFKCIIRRMSAAANNWRILSLSVAMHPDTFRFNSEYVDMDKHADDIAEIGGAIATLLPKLRNLECGGASRNCFARTLYGHIAGLYTEQLRSINSQHPIYLPQNRRLRALNNVHIEYVHGINHRLPNMESGELVSLSLFDGPPNHSWAPFSTDSSSRVIEFTNLRKLRVMYGEVYKDQGVAVHQADGHPWELRLPSLAHLEISSVEGICPLLEYAVLPPNMESIYISMKCASFQNIAELPMLRAKRLSICINMRSERDPSGLAAVNRLLESARESKQLELSIHGRIPLVSPEHITCTALTEFVHFEPTPMDAVFAFMDRLPNLATIKFYAVDLDNTQTDLSIPAADDTMPVEPLHAKLTWVSLEFQQSQYPPEVVVAVAKYLLLRIPTLELFVAPQIPRQPVVDFVKTHAARYPHLGHTSLVLGD